MSTLQIYGELNGHMLGILMKELARRAIERIRAKRFLFQEFTKESYNPEKEIDIFTDADVEAQQLYLRSLQECTPQFGILGEEDNLRVPCTHPTLDIRWTLDPLDGTRAFKRRQSHGIGTMLALVCNNEVIGAIVGDVMTQEAFYTRPDSKKVHRVSDFAFDEVLQIDGKRALLEQYLLLRDPLPKYGEGFRHMFGPGAEPSLFRSYQIADGSIGTTMARLWKGEVGGVALRRGPDTPWDTSPIIGLSQKLGFVFLAGFREHSWWWKVVEPKPPTIVEERPYDLLIIHRSRLNEFKKWCSAVNHEFEG